MAQLFPRSRVSTFAVLSGGLINTNLKVELDSGRKQVVLRLYRNGSDVCRREAAILRKVRNTVPVPELIHAEPANLDRLGPFSVLEYVVGMTFQQLKRTGNLEAIQQAAASVGQTLAAIGRYQFQKIGRLLVDEGSDTVSVGAPYVEGRDTVPRILDQFLVSPNVERRVGSGTVCRLHDFMWSWAQRLADFDNDHSLVHGDFGNRNILVREKRDGWRVAAILDWEFAFSGSPLLDVGHFLRYERSAQPLREPQFSRAFVEYGGELPDQWRKIARVIDLTGIVECLTHDELPADLEAELIDLIYATLEDHDPS